METIPEIIPISDLRHRQNEILATLPKSPVVLTQHGRGLAVLVTIQQWNQLIELLDDQEDVIAALKAELELATGTDELVEWSEVTPQRVSAAD